MDLALINQQRLVCHKTQPTNKPIKQTTLDSRPDQVVIKKKKRTCPLVIWLFSVSQKENKRKWTNQKNYLDRPIQLKKNWRIREWQWYKLQWLHLERSQKAWKKRLADQSRPSRPHQFYNQIEYLKEWRRPEKRLPVTQTPEKTTLVKTGEKISQGVK